MMIGSVHCSVNNKVQYHHTFRFASEYRVWLRQLLQSQRQNGC